MSIEEAIRELTEATRENTVALKAVLAGATSAGAVAAATAAPTAGAAEEPKGETKKKAADKPKTDSKAKAADKPKADADAGEVTFEGLKEKLATWLGEYAEEDPEHPEVLARKAALKATLGKVGVERLGELEGNAVDIGRVAKWLDTKGKAGAVDGEGNALYGAGLWAEPASDESSTEEKPSSLDDL